MQKQQDTRITENKTCGCEWNMMTVTSRTDAVDWFLIQIYFQLG